MAPGSGLVQLTSVVGSFHAKVLVARLSAEGIRCQLDPYADGPYPLPVEIAVYVRAEELGLAREILLADAVDAAFSESTLSRRKVHRSRWGRLRWKEGR